MGRRYGTKKGRAGELLRVAAMPDATHTYRRRRALGSLVKCCPILSPIVILYCECVRIDKADFSPYLRPMRKGLGGARGGKAPPYYSGCHVAKKKIKPDAGDEGEPKNLDDLWESAADSKPQKIKWLLPGRIICGSISIIEGQKGVGKSSVAIALAASLTKGKPWLGRKARDKGDVLWIASEESWHSVIMPRLSAAGCDMKRVRRIKDAPNGGPGRISFPSGIGVLHHALKRWPVRLVVVDPWISCLDINLSPNIEQQVRSALDPLNGLMIGTGCTALMSRHWTKNTSADRIDRGLGSVAVGAVARSVLSVEWPDRRDTRRVLRVVACNEANQTPPLEYRLAGEPGLPKMVDLRELDQSQDDPDGDLDDVGTRDARRDARILLQTLLATEYVPYQVIYQEAKNAGLSESTLRSVKVELGVRSRRIGSAVPPHWEWGPPKKGWQ